jgi:hypothetical protein
MNQPNKTGKDYDRLENRSPFNILSDTYTEFYNPSEHFATDKGTALFKGRVIVKQHISKKQKCFGIMI